MAKNQKKNKGTGRQRSLNEAFLVGLEHLFQELDTKPFLLTSKRFDETVVEWEDSETPARSRVERRFVLTLRRDAEDGLCRLAMHIPRYVVDEGGEYHIVPSITVWLTSGRDRGWPVDVMDRLQAIALKTLVQFDEFEFSEEDGEQESDEAEGESRLPAAGLSTAGHGAASHREPQPRGSDDDRSGGPASLRRA
jgi:hypothetical protein